MLGPSWPKRPKRDRSGTPSAKEGNSIRIPRGVASLQGSPMIFSPFLSIPLFFGMLLLLEAGRRFKARTGLEPSATIENADFALFGLLLAFTFSGAIGRFDEHRALITEEINAIDAAYHRLDLLPPETQPPIRQLFRDYVTTRLHQYET